MFKSSLTTSLIAAVLGLPSLGKIAEGTTPTIEIEKTTSNRSTLAASKINFNTKNKSKTANLSSLSLAKEHSVNAFSNRTDAKLSLTNNAELETANLDNRSNPRLAKQNFALSLGSSTTTLAAKPKSRVHIVGHGDTIGKIARRYSVSKNDLVRLNQLNNSSVIFISQRLQIPTTKTALASTESFLNNLQKSTSQVNSSIAAKVVNPELHQTTGSSNLNSDRQIAAKENLYITKLRTEIEQLRNQKQQSPQANKNSSAFGNSKSLNDGVHLVGEDNIPQVQTVAVSVTTSVLESNSQPSLLPEDSIAMQLPPLPPDEYLPSAFDGYIWPAQGILTSGYGWRWGRMHRGIDIAAPIGTPIVAAASGEVIDVGWQSGYGNLVKLKHLDGSVTVYAHNHQNLVSHGQKVDQGEQIAEMGNTGRSTGPHVHFEIRSADEGAINPLALLGKK